MCVYVCVSTYGRMNDGYIFSFLASHYHGVTGVVY